MFGEDLPAIVPISIILTIFVMFFLSSLSFFLEKPKMVSLREESFFIEDMVIKKYGDGKSFLNRTKLFDPNSSTSLSKLGLNDRKPTMIKIRDLENENYWIINNTNLENMKEREYVLTSTYPTLIKQNGETSLSKIHIWLGAGKVE